MNRLLTASLAYRVAVLVFGLYTVSTLCFAIIGALTGREWEQLDGEDKLLIVLAIIGNWTNTLMAFISKRAQKLENGTDTSTKTTP